MKERVVEIINFFAILLSPIIAVLITIFLQNRKDKHNSKMNIFITLISTRNRPPSEEIVRALNMIDVIFSKDKEVRKLWREYYDMLSNEGLNNPVGWNQREQKNLEMITAIAKNLGYKKHISGLDVNRVYFPIGLKDQLESAAEIGIELKRVLKETKAISVIPKKEGEI
jgi:hypothetical protein